MERLLDYSKVDTLIKQINVEKVYPLSIVEGYQDGKIYVDNAEKPTVALFWHYCGFAFIAGKYSESECNEIIDMMTNPTENHSKRLVIQSENKLAGLGSLLCRDRYIFSFANQTAKAVVPDGCRLCFITDDNYDLLRGRIVPTFSWGSKQSFLNKGFGVCLIKNDEMVACAFSAAVSKEYVDIGVETSEKYRGNGYGKVVAAAMVDEIIRQGKVPTWACDTQNVGSMKIACSVGFKIEGTHPWYTLK